jgi:hypothetical protein
MSKYPDNLHEHVSRATDIHSCSYYCDRPECIKRQRDEMRDATPQPQAAPQEPTDAEPVAEVIIGGNGHIGILPLGPLEHEQPLYAAPRPRIKDLIAEERQRRAAPAAPQEPTDARAKALEEAAKICDDTGPDDWTSQHCAFKIRAAITGKTP